MPRQARTISATNVYHAILRGVNKQQVFEDDEDYIRFLNVLRRQTQPDVEAQGQTFQPRCYVYAYCLMGNHVHLLLKEGSSHVSQAFHTPLFKGRQAMPSVMAAWDVSLFLVTRNLRPTLMIRNMSSSQDINICCGPAESVPLTPIFNQRVS